MASKYKNFVYDEPHGFIFAYVPKVACTNWKSLLRYMAGHADWLDNKLAHDKVHGGLRYLDLGGSDAALLNDPSIRKYAMVRDPYSRILSAYLNKVENRLPVKPKTEGEDHFQMVVREIGRFRREKLGGDNFPEITFEVFLRWLKEGTSPFTKDEHWALQSILLRQPEVIFDDIGRFEALSRDAPRILRAIGCDQDFPSQKDVNFAPTDARSKVAQYFDAVTYELVNKIFARDFDSFGYDRKTPAAPEAPMMPPPIGPMPTPSDAPPVIDTISERDWMWKANPDTEAYLNAGWSVGRTLRAAQIVTGAADPTRILDFGCGHGRVMRWLRALYPQATLVASDRVRDGVDFCAATFSAEPVYSNDSYADIPLGEGFDLIWLGSVYTHLPMRLWGSVTDMLTARLARGGMLAFSFAGPHVARHIAGGTRNAFAEIPEQNMAEFLRAYNETGFGYNRHDGVGDREWGRSVISHTRLFDFLHDRNLQIALLGEQLYGSWQDIVVARRRDS